MLEELAAYLVDEDVAAMVYIGQMPDSPDAAIAIYGYPGRPPSFDHDSPQPATRHPRLQVLCRDISQPLAMARASSAYTALCGIVNREMGADLIGRVAPIQEPFLLRIDESERAVVACNYEVTIL